MKFRKQIIAALGAALTISSLGLTNTVSAKNTDSTTTVQTEKEYKWAYPFKANQKNGVNPMYNSQTFGITNYLRSTNPISYFHDGWDFGFSEVGHSNVYAIHEGTVKKVAYGNGLGWFVWVISPDNYVQIYQEGFNKKKDIKVKTGQKIKLGQKIGKLTGSHLHLGITKTNKKYINKNGYPCNNWNVNNGTWLNPIKVIEDSFDD